MIAVNLIPEAIQSEQARRGRLRAWAVASVCAAALACIPLVTLWLDSARVESMTQQSELARAELSQLRASLRRLTAEVQDVTLHLDRARALRSKRAWSSLLALIGDALPQECWLASIATDPISPPVGSRLIEQAPPRATPAPRMESEVEEHAVVLIEGPRAIRLSGHATDASAPLAFVTRLKETGLFRTVNLEGLRSEQSLDRSTFSFDVLCGW